MTLAYGAKEFGGSSPRLRGTQGIEIMTYATIRFIPAPAGNAIEPIDWDALKPVHPRACGERLQPRLKPELRGGSSPRLRGTPPVVEQVVE